MDRSRGPAGGAATGAARATARRLPPPLHLALPPSSLLSSLPPVPCPALQVLRRAAENGELVNVALNTHGTRAVQKLIETLTSREQVGTGLWVAGCALSIEWCTALPGQQPLTAQHTEGHLPTCPKHQSPLSDPLPSCLSASPPLPPPRRSSW